MSLNGLSDLVEGTVVRGLEPSGDVRLIAVESHGAEAATITWERSDGSTGRRLLFTNDAAQLEVLTRGARWSFDADGGHFLLAAEARRLRHAHLFDPHLALSTSVVEPLPHQIQAVYGPMLDRQPLRFLLADDPGAGKTIMTGLFIKELALRGDLERCLIVAPGSLVEQWQDELGEKFGLEFSILTRADIEASRSGNPFAERDLIIARLDQLSRDEELAARAAGEEWDLVAFDEAHKLAARYFGNELKMTKRYVLGQRLGAATRNLLLLTATPHSGIDDDFQQFVALLDSDRFAGRQRKGGKSPDVGDIMRRMLKEDLLTFDGKPLFPERRANTVAYELSKDERRLYQQVTEYVREEMGRAERIVSGNRRNTIGFALTILQRRLASSPAAIHNSLKRRKERLEKKLKDIEELRFEQIPSELDITEEDFDVYDELPDAEVEALEDLILDEATAAETVDELKSEISRLNGLLRLSSQVVASEEDTKWMRLRDLVEESPLFADTEGRRRKLIIFTEHRDTLTYLAERLRRLLGRRDAVVEIHGGMSRESRKLAQKQFSHEENTSFLVATDAAGEGVNLQQAHLMVNYDLPWNPNRIEQRFGRIHRIGQKEVCHLWNLVAKGTREGDVFERLLTKLEVEREALDGRVYDVLGEVFQGDELRKLLMEAVRYGDQPEVRARLDQTIDDRVGEGLKNVLAAQALHADMLTFADVEEIRLAMERAEARRLQPHFIKLFFERAFAALGGDLKTTAEDSRYRIPHVPAHLRRGPGRGGSGGQLPKQYQRVVFEKDRLHVAGKPTAALIAPGHPLFDRTVGGVELRHQDALTRGSVLVADADPSTDPYLMVMLQHSIEDGRSDGSGRPYTVSRRFQFVLMPVEDGLAEGGVSVVEGAPYLDMRPAEQEEQAAAKEVMGMLDAEDVERLAIQYAIGQLAQQHIEEVRSRIVARVDKVEQKVKERLHAEIAYWDERAHELAEQERAGKTPRLNSQHAARKAEEFSQRLQTRLGELEQERQLSPQRPVVLGAAIVLPGGFLATKGLGDPGLFSISQAERDRVERAAVDAVLAVETANLAQVTEKPRNNPGFDVESIRPSGEMVFIEVKGRAEGAATFTVTKTEILTGLNKRERYVLALISVADLGSTDIRYIENPFSEADERQVGVSSVNYEWKHFWNTGHDPRVVPDHEGRGQWIQ